MEEKKRKDREEIKITNFFLSFPIIFLPSVNSSTDLWSKHNLSWFHKSFSTCQLLNFLSTKTVLNQISNFHSCTFLEHNAFRKGRARARATSQTVSTVSVSYIIAFGSKICESLAMQRFLTMCSCIIHKWGGEEKEDRIIGKGTSTSTDIQLQNLFARK